MASNLAGTNSAFTYEFVSDPTSGHTNGSGKARGIYVGSVSGGSVLYLISMEGGSETQFSDSIAAGVVYPVQFVGIGESTTCSKVTILY